MLKCSLEGRKQPGTSQVASVRQPPWPLNNVYELTPHTPGVLSGGLLGNTQPWSHPWVLTGWNVCTHSGFWALFQNVCCGPYMSQNLIRQADLDKFTPKGQCHEHWVGSGNGPSDYLRSHGNDLFLAESLSFLKGEMVLVNYEAFEQFPGVLCHDSQQRCVRA